MSRPKAGGQDGPVIFALIGKVGFAPFKIFCLEPLVRTSDLDPIPVEQHISPLDLREIADRLPNGGGIGKVADQQAIAGTLPSDRSGIGRARFAFPRGWQKKHFRPWALCSSLRSAL